MVSGSYKNLVLRWPQICVKNEPHPDDAFTHNSRWCSVISIGTRL